MGPESFMKLNKVLSEKAPTEQPGILEEGEMEALIISLAQTRDEDGFTEEEAFKLIKWAEGVRISESLLELVLKGFATINWDNAANEPSFQITESGRVAFEMGDNNGFSN